MSGISLAPTPESLDDRLAFYMAPAYGLKLATTTNATSIPAPQPPLAAEVKSSPALDARVVDFSNTAFRADIGRAGTSCITTQQNHLCLQSALLQTQPQRLNGVKYFLTWLSARLRRRTSKNVRHVINEGDIDGSQSNPIPLGFYPYRDLTSQIERQSYYPVAYGGFGDVHRCTLHMRRQVTEVAVKSLRPHTVSGDVAWCNMGKMLHREISVWARLENENILPFYGVAFGFGPLPALVCPWAANGTLHQYLMDHGDLDLLDRLKLVRIILRLVSFNLHCYNTAL
ncbi:hypothetical protein PAXINDRAFT_20824 [Paxillus involutus ATCC 200175]|uniref:Protein kinase domain-containing protein n=1 Tax=Paxillus involutus ATCC 200175 TaxID=664439 RepID=A0A0C9TFB0_PAXIN|nr:hypothetical protein PAXINDRAFT_20824 [Paxillus involutus ATCC 200175]